MINSQLSHPNAASLAAQPANDAQHGRFPASLPDDPARSESALDSIGIPSDALAVIASLNAQFEALSERLPKLDAEERLLFRLQARGNSEQADRVKDLSAQFSALVPGSSTAPILHALDDARDQFRSELARMQATFIRMQDVATFLNRDYLRRVRAARAALRSESRYSGAGLREQVQQTIIRRRKRKDRVSNSVEVKAEVGAGEQ